MKITVKETLLVYLKKETHYKLDVNGKEIWINKWQESDSDFSQADGDTEIIKGVKDLTEEQQEEVIEFVNNKEE